MVSKDVGLDNKKRDQYFVQGQIKIGLNDDEGAAVRNIFSCRFFRLVQSGVHNIKIGGNKLIGFEKIIAEKVLFGLENKP